MKSVLLSIHPKYAHKILDGKKTIEVRKTRPKIETPFKCYIYMTAGEYEWQKEPFSTAVIPPSGEMYNGSRMVVAEFTCDKIIYTCGWRLKGNTGRTAPRTPEEEALPGQACLTLDEILAYVGENENRIIYGWHISDLKVYDKPKDLQDFRQCHKCPYGDLQNCLQHEYSCDGAYTLTQPPRSWCYAEEAP